jgi:hypothetical protein
MDEFTSKGLLRQDEADTAEMTRLVRVLSSQQLRYLTLMWRYPDDASLARAIGEELGSVKSWHADYDFTCALDLWKRNAATFSRSILEVGATEAAMMIVKGLQSGDEKIRIATADSLLDRVLGKPTQRVENEGHIIIEAGGDRGPFADRPVLKASEDGGLVELDAEAEESD